MNGKRQYRRVPISSYATLKFKNNINGPSIEMTVGNISQSGICLYTDRPVKNDQKIFLTIKFLSIDGYIYTEPIEGKIVYVIRIGHQYLLGVGFDEKINKTNQPHLYEYLVEAQRLN